MVTERSGMSLFIDVFYYFSLPASFYHLSVVYHLCWSPPCSLLVFVISPMPHPSSFFSLFICVVVEMAWVEAGLWSVVACSKRASWGAHIFNAPHPVSRELEMRWAVYLERVSLPTLSLSQFIHIRFHLHKLLKCGHDYHRKWWWSDVSERWSFIYPHLLTADQTCVVDLFQKSSKASYRSKGHGPNSPGLHISLR